MKNKILIIGSIFGFAILLVALAGFFKFNFTNDDIYLATEGKLNSKDGTYIINNKKITLKDGYYEEAVSPGLTLKYIYRYFGNEVKADFNNDNKLDVAFLLTEEAGGSATFFYIAAQISRGDKFVGTNAVLLGDRIAPQTTEFRDGLIITNFADRLPSEPYTSRPSIGVSKYFKIINNSLVETK